MNREYKKPEVKLVKVNVMREKMKQTNCSGSN